MNIENHACDPHKCGYPQAIGGYGRLPPSFFAGAVITTAQEYKQSLTEKKRIAGRRRTLGHFDFSIDR